MRLFFSRKHQERKSGDDMPLTPTGSSPEGDGIEPNTENKIWAEYALGGVAAEEIAIHRQEIESCAAPAMQQVAPAMQQSAEFEPHSSQDIAAQAASSLDTYTSASNHGMDPEVLEQLKMVTAGIFTNLPSKAESSAAVARAEVVRSEDALIATSFTDDDLADDIDAEDDSAHAESNTAVAFDDTAYIDDDSYEDEDVYDDSSSYEDDYEDNSYEDDEDVYVDEDSIEGDKDAIVATSIANDFVSLGGMDAAQAQIASSFSANTDFNLSTNDDLRVNAASNANADAVTAAAVASMLVRERLETHVAQETDGIGSPDGFFNECEFKFEEVDSSEVTDPDPPTLTPFFEEDDLERQEREELLAERVAAQKQERLKFKSDSSQFFDARLQNMQMIRVHAPTLLDEDTEHGEMETEDFITGNVTILATGTDSAGGGTSSGARRADGDDEGDGDDLDNPNKEVIDIIELIPGQEDYRSSVSLGYDASLRPREPKLVPLLFQDILKNCLVYFFAVVACLLCLAKIYQVQETRELTSCLNEISLKNTDLENEKLSLLAASQSLSEYIKVSTFAREQLHMQAPKIENEQVIFLQR